MIVESPDILAIIEEESLPPTPATASSWPTPPTSPSMGCSDEESEGLQLTVEVVFRLAITGKKLATHTFGPADLDAACEHGVSMGSIVAIAKRVRPSTSECMIARKRQR